MNPVKSNNAYWLLRIGFAASYLYSGFDMFFVPHHWYAYLPHWFSMLIFQQGFSADQYLKIQGVVEVMIGLLFIAWFLDERTKFGSYVLQALYGAVAVQIVLILLFSGVDPNTFRDFVYLGGSLALLSMSVERAKQYAKIQV